MTTALNLALFILVVSTALCVVRLLRGPSLPDRVVALDQVGIHVVALSAVYSIQVGQIVFLDVAIVAALLAFIATVAFARYLEQGKDL
ncbi:MAG: monovalent cation/H+ antiporter complex subunit F [Candidatus Promineifilaceae bacterium]|nr:monovalent cation/H+ antiporter complex subunit F [Candidatus Promineifilaceae bacterium]